MGLYDDVVSHAQLERTPVSEGRFYFVVTCLYTYFIRVLYLCIALIHFKIDKTPKHIILYQSYILKSVCHFRSIWSHLRWLHRLQLCTANQLSLLCGDGLVWVQTPLWDSSWCHMYYAHFCARATKLYLAPIAKYPPTGRPSWLYFRWGVSPTSTCRYVCRNCLAYKCMSQPEMQNSLCLCCTYIMVVLSP